jgi:hypothetical protein
MPELLTAPLGPDPGLVSLVIPVLNERESLPALFAEIAEVAEANRLRVEVVFVDDGSTDGSWDVIAELSAKHPEVRGVKFRRNFGKAAALAAGFKEARGGVGHHPRRRPAGRPARDPALPGVAAGRVRRGQRLEAEAARPVAQGLAEPGVQLAGRVGDRGAIARPQLRHEGVPRRGVPRGEALRRVAPLHPGAGRRRGFKVGELVINHRPRKFGYSKYGFRRFAKGFLDLITVKFLTGFGNRPQHLLGNFGLIPVTLGLLGLFLLAVNAVVRVASNQTLGASAMVQIVFAFLSVGFLLFGTQLVVTGLIAELIVGRGPDDLEPYCVAERTPPTLPPTAVGDLESPDAA